MKKNKSQSSESRGCDLFDRHHCFYFAKVSMLRCLCIQPPKYSTYKSEEMSLRGVLFSGGNHVSNHICLVNSSIQDVMINRQEMFVDQREVINLLYSLVLW